MGLNELGQPNNKKFNNNRNIEKAVYGLKGILIGVTADKKLNEQELLFLDIWLRSHDELKDDGDVIDLLDLIGDILEDGVITNEELRELNDSINDIIQYKDLKGAAAESQINELVGLLSGILADSVIKDSEIEGLMQWLNRHEDIKDVWPANVVIQRLHEILEDNIVTEEERNNLIETFKQITGVRFDESGIAHGMATEFFEDEVDNVLHKDKNFCFTGAFVTGTRKIVEKSATNKGAVTKKDVAGNTDYLVIGTLASRDWRFSSHGRKIEKAIRLKEEGLPIKIITERTWLKYA